MCGMWSSVGAHLIFLSFDVLLHNRSNVFFYWLLCLSIYLLLRPKYKSVYHGIYLFSISLKSAVLFFFISGFIDRIFFTPRINLCVLESLHDCKLHSTKNLIRFIENVMQLRINITKNI